MRFVLAAAVAVVVTVSGLQSANGQTMAADAGAAQRVSTTELEQALAARPDSGAPVRDMNAATARAEAMVNEGAPIELQQVAVAGTRVLAARVSSDVDAPFDVMSVVVSDFGSYNTFLPQVRDSRVIQRRRGEVDVYLTIVLLNNFGTLWSLSRFTITREPGHVRMDGHLVNGNMARFDSLVEIRAIPGTNRTRLTMQMLGIPTFPFPDSIVTNQQPYWTRLGLIALRDRGERIAAGALPMPGALAGRTVQPVQPAPSAVGRSAASAGDASARAPGPQVAPASDAGRAR